MDSTRQSKVSRLIQKELGLFFQKNATTFAQGQMISVTVVRISPDMGVAKAYLSVFPAKNKEEILKLIKKEAKSIRFLLGKVMRHQLRVIPEILFYLDDSLDYAENINKLLD